jgi:NADPH-dependent 2,4-dienoyl-CoA reductase/sulfur reductase-like enzyme
MPDGPAQAARRLVIVGAVAAGTSVGAKARRNDEAMQIVVYERDQDISYSGCGLPYFIGGQVPDAEVLHPRDPKWFADRFNIDIRTRHEVLAIDRDSQTLQVRNLATGEEFADSYDTLVLATGARSVVPPVPGVGLPGVFALRNVADAVAIRGWLEVQRPERAVVVG